MSFRTWVYVAAIGIALSGQAWSQAAREDQPRQEESTTDANSDGDSQDGQAIDLTPALENIESAIRDLIAEEDKIEAQRRQDNESRDLAAQEGMRYWAKWMFIATAATVVLTAVALFAIIRTLHHTRRAADYTEKMLGDAEISSAAAMAAAGAAQEASCGQSS